MTKLKIIGIIRNKKGKIEKIKFNKEPRRKLSTNTLNRLIKEYDNKIKKSMRNKIWIKKQKN